MLKKSSIKIILDEQSCKFTGGQKVTGNVVLYVPERKQMQLNALKLDVMCDVKISIGDDRTIQDDRSRCQDYRNGIRFYADEYVLRSHTEVLDPGRHFFPFTIFLPLEGPPSCQEEVSTLFYGGVSHAIEAVAYRTSLKTNEEKKLLKDRLRFEYIPTKVIRDTSKTTEYVFTRYLHSKHNNSFRNLIIRNSKPVQDPNLAVNCILTVPSVGIRQDKPNTIKLFFVPEDRSSPIKLKVLDLSIETVLVLKSGPSRRESKLSITNLFHQKDALVGDIINMSPALTALTLKKPLVPSFSTFKLTRSHRLRIEATLVRDSQEINFTEVVPINVLSPYIKLESALYPTASPSSSSDLNEYGFPKDEKHVYHHNEVDDEMTEVMFREDTPLEEPPSYMR